MLLLLAVAQAILLLLVLLLFFRKTVLPGQDERLLRLPEEFVALNARLDGANATTRDLLIELRREHAEAAQRHQTASLEAAKHLREEVWGSIEKLSRALNDGLTGFRTDNARGADKLTEQVHATLREIDTRLQNFARDTQLAQDTAREVLHGKLNELGSKNQQSHEAFRESVQSKLTGLGEDQRQHHDRMREAVEARLEKLNQANTAKLEEMRVTVDEKLNSTLTERLTASFGQVSEHLGQVQKGLGEMREFATGVSDLKKVFSNVKARGIVGEFQLEQQLAQMFSPEQYEKNVQVKPGGSERVDYALKWPQHGETVYLPIDAKFPRDDWERLEHAYEHGGADEIAAAGKAFERAIREEAKSICGKYIYVPSTTPYAVMFLPTEALYAEVIRRPGLQQELQQQCSVVIAGPSTLMAILTSFRMSFQVIEIHRKGHQIEKVLSNVKTEFGKFGDLIGKVETQVGTVQTTLGKIRSKTTTITKSLHNVTDLPAGEASEEMLRFEDFSGVVTRPALEESAPN